MPKIVIKKCNKHGETEHRLENEGTKWERLRCKKCGSEAVQRRRKKVKRLLVEYKGGKCEKCGYNKCIEALDFHHKNPNEKDFGISANGHTKSLDKLKKEVDKCQLVCANCHREIHAEEN
jgi:predicted RNA-binding Zn-ribbon protein involved in translation (DUF1610 family)